jgi:hypothetical protein
MRHAFPLLLLLLGSTAATAAEAPPAAPVEVHLREYAVEMPKTLPAGPTTFVVHNDGKKFHSFKIEGPGSPRSWPPLCRPRKRASSRSPSSPASTRSTAPSAATRSKG